LTDARRALEKALKDVDSRLRGRPASLDLKFERARLLDRLGRSEEARKAYVEILQRDANHFGALNDLGMLLFRAGHRADALTCFNAAVAKHPANPVGRANLALVLLRGGDAVRAREQYEAAVELDPSNAEARRGLALALDALGETERAKAHREAGFGAQPIVTLPYRGSRPPVRVLLIVSASPGNVPTDRFLDDRVFATSKLVAEYYRPDAILPDHGLIFNAVGDADICGDALNAAEAVVERSGAPAINPPSRVRETGRIDNARRFRTLYGVVVPEAFAASRNALVRNAEAEFERHGLAFPLLLRSPGYHAGANLERVDGGADVAAAIAKLPGERLFASQFVDTRGRDGYYRKYRAIFVGDRFYPLHLAVSRHWKVHYFSAATQSDARLQNEERTYLEAPDTALGETAMRALDAIRSVLGLDYGGIDFALDAQGRPIVFEANATMIVPPPDPDPGAASRRTAVERIEAAVREMLLERAATRARRS